MRESDSGRLASPAFIDESAPYVVECKSVSGLRGYRILPEGVRRKATGESMLCLRKCRGRPETALGFLLDVRIDPLNLLLEGTGYCDGPGSQRLSGNFPRLR